MRLGAPVFETDNAESWAKRHIELGYGAAYWPFAQDTDPETEAAYVNAAKTHGLIIAEVGGWCNLLDPDPEARERNIQYDIGRLRCAERVGARVCVNITGSRSSRWDAPHPQNLTEETLQLAVQNARRIIDESEAKNAHFCYEPMPWMYPTGVEDTRRLIEAVDRPAFGVHVDMANLMNTPERVYRNAELTDAFFQAFSNHIRSIHIKDTRLSPELTTHISEALAGEGQFDFDALLRRAQGIPDVCCMLEHLQTAEEYDRAAAYLQSRVCALGLSFEEGIA